MNLPTRSLFALPLSILLTTAAASAQEYKIDQSVGADTFGARSTGQTFTPQVGINPDPGSPATLPLVEMTIYHGNYTASAPSATTFLNIYDGDPNSGGNFVGSSTNSIDTNGLSFHTPMVWSFNQLALTYTTEHWAIMSSTNTPGALDVAVSLETEPRNGPPGPNIYTGGSGLIANIAPHPNSVDARFEVVFHAGVRGSFTVLGTGCPGSAGPPTLSSPTRPTIGQVLQIDVGNLAPAGLPFLVFGVSDTNWNGVPLPFALVNLLPGTHPSCQVLVSVDVVASMTVIGTTGTLTLPIPNTPSLAGSGFFVQGWQFELSGVSLTPKAAVLIGN